MKNLPLSKSFLVFNIVGIFFSLLKITAADLVVENLDYNAIQTQYQQFHCTVTIKNIGTDLIDNFNVVKVVFSKDTIYGNDKSAGYANLRSLATNESITLDIYGGAEQFGINADSSYKYILVQADYRDEINEENENNNLWWGDIKIKNAVVDLTVNSHYTNNTGILRPGDIMYMHIGLTNLGNENVHNTNYDYYISQDTIFNEFRDFKVSTYNYASFYWSSVTTELDEFTIPSLPHSGIYYVFAKINTNGQEIDINDSNLENNVSRLDKIIFSDSPSGIYDNKPPEISCLTNQELCSNHLLPDYTKLVTVYENFEEYSIIQIPEPNTLITESTTIKLTATDTAGNSSKCEFKVNPIPVSDTIISISACTSYSSPSGKNVWTESGIYLDTILSSMGCDSIITFSLEILPTKGSTITAETCNNYKSPSKKYIWTKSGIFMDTLISSIGCDSIITINLTVNTPTKNSISPVVCNEYLSPSKKYTWNNTGIYYDTIQNISGCDSIISIDLTIAQSENYIFTSSCGNFVSPSKKYIWTESGIYNDTIPNSLGCDSIITIDLIINNPTLNSFKHTACGSFASPSNKYVWDTSGIYIDTISNSDGCDSIIFIDLTILPPSPIPDNIDCLPNTFLCYNSPLPDFTSSINIEGNCLQYKLHQIPEPGFILTDTTTIAIYTTFKSSNTIRKCEFEIIPQFNDTILEITSCGNYSLNGSIYERTGTYTQILTSNIGCDSIITINLTIQNIDTTTNEEENILTANATGATYQWLNCNNNSEITGATNQSFTPTESGDYAVVIEQNGCIDTSKCYSIVLTNINHKKLENRINVYPNPTSGELNIDLDKTYEKVEIEIKSLIGQTIQRYNLLKTKSAIIDLIEKPGIYFINVSTDTGEKTTFKIIKE